MEEERKEYERQKAEAAGNQLDAEAQAKLKAEREEFERRM